jgi:FkbM family methyltransferase
VKLVKRLIRRGLGALGYEIRRKVERPTAETADRIREDLLAADVVACIRAQRVDCVLDVGAHLGEFGDAIRRAGWSGPIVSFEPVSSSFERLRAHAVGDPCWTVHRMALGRIPDTAAIGVRAGSNLSSFLDPSRLATERWPELSEKTGSETVDIRRLDEVLADVLAPLDARRIFLKLDTQGFDLEVFAGAGASLDRIVGLLAEISFQPVYHGMPHHLEAMAEFERAGFSAVGFYPITRDPQRRLIEADCLMVLGPGLTTEPSFVTETAAG